MPPFWKAHLIYPFLAQEGPKLKITMLDNLVKFKKNVLQMPLTNQNVVMNICVYSELFAFLLCTPLLQ